MGECVIGNDVEVGANTTIDRGALDDTVLEEGVKLDNQIQIGHNCRIGAHTAIAGCVGIAGSTRIGRYCRIGGSAMIGGHLEIVDNVEISGATSVPKSMLKAGTYTSLYPDLFAPGLAQERFAHPSSRFSGHSGKRTGAAFGGLGKETNLMSMEIKEILKYLPHRYPFLLVDRVVSCEPGKKIRSDQERCHQRTVFPGAFPGEPGDARSHDPRSPGAGSGNSVVQNFQSAAPRICCTTLSVSTAPVSRNRSIRETCSPLK